MHEPHAGGVVSSVQIRRGKRSLELMRYICTHAVAMVNHTHPHGASLQPQLIHPSQVWSRTAAMSKLYSQWNPAIDTTQLQKPHSNHCILRNMHNRRKTYQYGCILQKTVNHGHVIHSQSIHLISLQRSNQLPNIHQNTMYIIDRCL